MMNAIDAPSSAAVAPSNLDAAMTMRSADTELQNTLELRAKAPLEIAAPRPDLDAKGKKHYVEALFKRNIKENHQRQI